LTEALKKCPDAVVLLDEVEKVHTHTLTHTHTHTHIHTRTYMIYVYGVIVVLQ
jgi:hypothetical protein